MNYLNFDKSELINLEYSLSREMLRSNRAGSYASTTIIACNTRKYHGLLICPMEHLDGDRHVLLSTLDFSIIQGKSEFNLGIHKYQGDLYNPKGHIYIQDFQAEKSLQIFYRVGGVRILRESLLIEKEQQMLISYTILEADKPVVLRFTPFLAFRNVHQLSKANLHAQTRVRFIKNGIKIRLYDGYPYLHMQFNKEAEFTPSPDWFYNIEYIEEQHRGYDYKEDLFVPGYFELSGKKGETIFFSASTYEINPLTIKRKYATELNKRIPRDNFKNCLINSAQQFIIRKEKKTEITSGFHWYGTSARNTFMSLPGLTLPLNDIKTFKAVTDSMLTKLSNGVFPDVGPDDDVQYYSPDASLWFIWSLQQYYLQTHNGGFIWKSYSRAIKNILKQFRENAIPYYQMLDNGLLYAGEHGKALTWMNAQVNGKPVTPRKGCAVEVNALWYNAILFSIELAERVNEQPFIKKWNPLAQKINASFIESFWSDKHRYLADYVDKDHKDWIVRPNQVIAVSVPYSPVTDEMKKSILEIVQRDLLTPRGLRTLAPNHPDYVGKYEGNEAERDMAFHQGSVWPWFLEHFCEGYLRLYKKSGLALIKSIIRNFEPTVSEHGIGTTSELYDGDPPYTARGAISYAANVAALLSVIDKTEKMESKE